MIEKIEIYFLLFIIYSVFGWIIETLGNIIQTKKFTNRGFLIGPYCPIYGFGGITITILLGNFMKSMESISLTDSIWISSVVIISICGLLEYLTSYFMEKLFKARWWDYHKFKFNINGRICLETLIPFTIVGQLILRYISPALIEVINQINQTWLHIISGVLFTTIIVDIWISYNIINSLKKVSCEAKDNTEEITTKVKEIISKSWRGRRLVSAFPNVDMDVIREKIKLKVEESKEKIEKKKKDIEKMIEQKIKK